MPVVTGTFEVQLQFEAPFSSHEGVNLGRASGPKRFEGPLSGQSTVHMLSALTAVKGSAGYVAIERIEGAVSGRTGSFVALHTGLMDRGSQLLEIRIVPDSGTGALSGIRGVMDIRIQDGQHHYTLDYELPDSA